MHTAEWYNWVTRVPFSVFWGPSMLISIVTDSGNTLSQARLVREAGLSCGQDVLSFLSGPPDSPFGWGSSFPACLGMHDCGCPGFVPFSCHCHFSASFGCPITPSMGCQSFPLFRTDSLSLPWTLAFHWFIDRKLHPQAYPNISKTQMDEPHRR